MRIESGKTGNRSEWAQTKMRRMLLISVSVLIADQLSKVAIRAHLPVREPQPLLPPVLYFTHIENTGAAFGLLSDRPLLLAAITVGVLLAAIFGARHLAAESPSVQWAVALGAGGAAGNMIDRVLRGAVTDFVDVRVWPIFNLADMSIVIGVALLLLHILRGRRANT